MYIYYIFPGLDTTFGTVVLLKLLLLIHWVGQVGATPQETLEHQETYVVNILLIMVNINGYDNG